MHGETWLWLGGKNLCEVYGDGAKTNAVVKCDAVGNDREEAGLGRAKNQGAGNVILLRDLEALSTFGKGFL